MKIMQPKRKKLIVSDHPSKAGGPLSGFTHPLKLPDVAVIKTSNKKLTIHFDPAKEPSRSAKLRTRLAFAAALVRRTCDGQPASLRQLRLCAKWIDEAVKVVI